MISYRVQNPSTAPYSAAGIPQNVKPPALPQGVTQLYTGNNQCGNITVDIDHSICSGVPCADDPALRCFNFNENRQNCTLLLCVNGGAINGAATGGPEVCGYPEAPGSCSVPYSDQQINVKVIPSASAELEFVDTTFLPPPNPDNTALLMPGGSFTWALKNIGTSPAQAVRPIFNSTTLDNLESINYADCYNKPLDPNHTCSISVVVKDTAPINGELEPVSFEGTNTNDLMGYVVFGSEGSLTASNVIFHAPGAAGQVDMQLTNNTSSDITISSLTFSGVGATGNEISAVDYSPPCTGTVPNITIPAGSNCNLQLQATADAYVNDNTPGLASIEYQIDTGAILTMTANVSIDDAVLLINEGKKITIPPVAGTRVRVPLLNVGNFNLQNLALSHTGDLTDVEIKLAASCSQPLPPLDNTCKAVFKVTSDAASSSNAKLEATGTNIIPTYQNVLVGTVDISTLPPASQHLQYTGVQISNQFSAGSGENVYLSKVINTFSSADVAWCPPSSATCVYTSGCGIGDSIAPGDECTLWFKSNDNGQTPQDAQKTGTIEITVADSPSPPRNVWKKTFNVTKKSDLYLTGTFTSVGPTLFGVGYIAKWNETDNWQKVQTSTGLQNYGISLALCNGDLYTGGSFNSADGVASTTAIAVWNGNNWASVDSGVTSASPGVNSLFPVDSTLYVGGSFTQVGGSTSVNNIAVLNDCNNWSALGASANGANNFINSITAFNSDIYVGGSFTQVGAPPSTPANNIAAWSGTAWSALGTVISGGGVNNQVKSILPNSSSSLLVGGLFGSADGSSAALVAEYNTTTNSWSSIDSGLYFTTQEIDSLVNGPSNILAAGTFSDPSDTTIGMVAQLNSTTWSTLGTLQVNGCIEASCHANKLYVYPTLPDNQVYVGGYFLQTSTVSDLNGIALLNGNDWSQIGPSSGGVNVSSGGQVYDIIIATSLVFQ